MLITEHVTLEFEKLNLQSLYWCLDNSVEMVEKGDEYGKRFEGIYLVGDDDKNGQEHGSCCEINKFRVAKHETTVLSSCRSTMPAATWKK